MTSTTPATPQEPRNDGEAIDWANVAVETTVMLRLQQGRKPQSPRSGSPANPAD